MKKRLLAVGATLIGISLFIGATPLYAESGDTVGPEIQSNVDQTLQTKEDYKARGIDIPSANNLTAPADASSYDGIMSMLMGIFAWLVGAAAILLDGAVYYTVVKMGDYINGLSAVGTAWHLLRDIGNIALIFGFIAVGMGLIVGSDFYGGGTKLLPTLLLSAVALNFSLFVSEAVIDVGNLFATQFYTQINGGAPAGQKSFFDSGVRTEGISNKIMAQVGLQTIYNVDFAQNKIVFKGGNMWIIGFMSIILFLIAAFVMLSLAFILIARFVYLLFIIITSPIGFAGYAIPKLEGYAKQWWAKLFEQTITAPILMLLLYIALLLITSPAFLTGLEIGTPGEAYLAWLNGGAGVGQLASALLSFLIAMGLLLAVVVASKNLSAFGSSAATKWGGRLSFGATSVAAGLAVGGTARALRFGLQRSPVRNSKFAQYTVSALRPLETMNLDVRRVPGVGAGLAAVGLKDVAAASGVSYKSLTEEPYKNVKETFEKSAKQYRSEIEEIEEGRVRKTLEAEAGSGVLSQASQKELSSLSIKELEAMRGIKQGVDALVQNLSPQQFEGLMKSDKLAGEEKVKIKAARYKPLGDAIAAGDVTRIDSAVNALSKGELEAMPAQMLADQNVLSALSDKQRDTLGESKERTAAEKASVRNSSRTGKVKEIFERGGGAAGGGAAAVAASPEFANLTVAQLAKLDKAILTAPEVAEKLTAPTLVKLATEEKLTPAQMKSIGLAIYTNPHADPEAFTYVSTQPGRSFWL